GNLMETSSKRLPTIQMEEIGGYCLRVAHWKSEMPLGKRPLLFVKGQNVPVTDPLAEPERQFHVRADAVEKKKRALAERHFAFPMGDTQAIAADFLHLDGRQSF
ncbi:MAG: hypothetical protein AAFQ84_02610, partial [Pseudomonadota bacterium]